VRIALLFKSFGPYHLARLRALRAQHTVLALEFHDVDGDYNWGVADQKRAEGIASLSRDAGAERRSNIVIKLEEELRRFSPDVVALPGYSEPLALAALCLCRKLRIPAILMSDSHALGGERNPFRETLKRHLIKLFQSALVAGQGHAAYLAGLGFPRNDIAMGYDVIDNRHFASGADNARENAATLRHKHGLPERYVFCCSRFVQKKNLFFLLDAFDRHRRNASDAWDLVIVGEGPLRDAIANHVSKLGLTSHVHLLGRKSYDELPEIYGLARAFVLPSLTDEWGLVVNEAMAAGLPVLVSKGAGCHEDLVEDGVNGHVFDPSDAAQLEGLLLKLSSSADCEAMGGASRRIISRWDLDRFAAGLTEASLIAKSAGNTKTFGMAPAIAAALSYRA
jgi:glycosyltransferase involved in cell wall biosynthesis